MPSLFIPPLQRSWKGGILVSPCPSVDRIVSALYLQQYSSDPFHICTSYQATSEGVSRVMFVSTDHNGMIRHDSVTVVTCAKFHCDRPNILWTRALLNFEFDQNFISGSGAWGPFYKWFSHWYSNAMQIVFAFIQMLIKGLLQNLRISNPNYSKYFSSKFELQAKSRS